MRESEARELRSLRAHALAIAGMSQAGKAFDLQLLYALADDVMDYITEGEERPCPTAERIMKGRKAKP